MAYYSSVGQFAFPGEISVLRIWIKTDQTKNPIKRCFRLKRGLFIPEYVDLGPHAMYGIKGTPGDSSTKGFLCIV